MTLEGKLGLLKLPYEPFHCQTIPTLGRNLIKHTCYLLVILDIEKMWLLCCAYLACASLVLLRKLKRLCLLLLLLRFHHLYFYTEKESRLNFHFRVTMTTCLSAPVSLS